MPWNPHSSTLSASGRWFLSERRPTTQPRPDQRHRSLPGRLRPGHPRRRHPHRRTALHRPPRPGPAAHPAHLPAATQRVHQRRPARPARRLPRPPAHSPHQLPAAASSTPPAHTRQPSTTWPPERACTSLHNPTQDHQIWPDLPGFAESSRARSGRDLHGQMSSGRSSRMTSFRSRSAAMPGAWPRGVAASVRGRSRGPKPPHEQAAAHGQGRRRRFFRRRAPPGISSSPMGQITWPLSQQTQAAWPSRT